MYANMLVLFRCKELVTNYRDGGGATKPEGGAVKFYPYENGSGISFSHAKRGGAQNVSR